MNTDRNIDIVIVCPEPSMERILWDVRKWNTENPEGRKFGSKVWKENDLGSALEIVQRNPEKSILVPLGYEQQDVCDLLGDFAGKLEVIIHSPSASHRSGEIEEVPSSSLLKENSVVNVHNTISALRKSLLKLRLRDVVSVRELRFEEDFENYFSLRYKVWTAMGYLPPHEDSPEIQWELNFTDRTALPIGAFTNDGRLVGCARLVFPLGRETHHVGLIQSMVAETGNAKLMENLAYPKGLTHPFDILESFHGFREYYAGLVRRHIRKAEVSRVVVAPEFRGYRLGEVLVDSLLSLATRHGIKVLFLACLAKHEIFYSRCGFKRMEGIQCERFAGVNVPAIGMACHISPQRDEPVH